MSTNGTMILYLNMMTYQLHQNGQPLGVFSTEQLGNMIRSGLITYETLAWTEGQSSWRPLRDLIPCSVAPLLPPAVPTPPKSESRRVHPVLSYFLPIGRIGRATFFVRNLLNLFGLGGIGALLSIGQSEMSDGVAVLIGCAFICVAIVNSAKRFHDLNVSAWFSPVVFVPLVPLLLLVLSGTKGPNRYGSEPPDFGTGY
jgi:uncharacterized membrane protein YhaH (DUF805 family)